jgi:hypothetical protein
MKKIAFALSVLGVTNAVFAVDLKKTQGPLFYECKRVLEAGLNAERKTGEVNATVFAVAGDSWGLKISSLNHLKDDGLKAKCDREKDFHRREHGLLNDASFCLIQTSYGEKGMQIETSNHCMLTMPKKPAGSNSTLICGAGNSILFDTDRQLGYEVPSGGGVQAFHLGFNRTLSVSKFECKRLDR